MANMISKMKNILGFGDFDEDFEDDEFEENFQDGSDDEMVVDESIEPVISEIK